MLLIKGGTIISMEQAPFKGDILVEEGKIAQISSERIEPSADAEIVEAEDHVVLPGLIDAHCHIGVFEDGMKWEGEDGCEEGDPITPQVRALDAINPMDPAFKEAYSEGGVTAAAIGPGSAGVICGQFSALKTYGNVVDEMLIKENVGMKVALGENSKDTFYVRKESPMTRMGLAAYLRNTLFKARDYQERLNAAARKQNGKKPDYDMKMEAMLPVINREVPLKVHVHRADDICTAIRVAKEFNLKMTLDHCTEGHLITEYLVKNRQFVPIIGRAWFQDRKSN
jgi:imidazolonepropionase-like amidohydrolase